MPKMKMKYNKMSLEIFFQELNRTHVKIKKAERVKNNAILNSVLGELLTKMKSCDDLFRSMNPKLEFLGSYYDGLRVGHATEYDINVVLKIHVNYDKIILDSSETQHAYTIVKMPAEFRRLSKTQHTATKGFHCTKMWCDRAFRLSAKQFKSWMQSVVDATVNTFPIQNNQRILKVNGKIYKIATKLSGPANTISLIDGNNIIDVDLVPTISFNLPKMPRNTNINYSKVNSTNINEYFVVPKINDNDFSWRLAFPFQERKFINKKYNMKSALKILKLIRDTQGFKKLASYYIKTLFLWESEEQSDEFWKQNSLSFLVIYMMKKLRDCLAIGIIRNFWCSEHNLLEKVKLETCRHWSNRLTHIIDVIEQQKDKSPVILLKYFVNSNN